MQVRSKQKLNVANVEVDFVCLFVFQISTVEEKKMKGFEIRNKTIIMTRNHKC